MTMRSFGTGHFLLSLDNGLGEPAYIKSVSGGMAKATMVQSSTGSDPLKAKHISTVEMEDIEFETGAASSKSLLTWVQQSWNKEYSRHSGMIIHADISLKARVEHEFYDALLSEVSFPALDASAKDGVYLKVKVHPERATMTRVAPYSVQSQTAATQKAWTVSNFRFNVDGLESACQRVSKVDSFAVKQKFKKLFIGRSRLPEITPTGVDFPNLTIYLAEQFAEPFLKWHQDFHITGRRDSEMEKTGSIEFLGQNMNDVLFTVSLQEMSILSYGIEKSEANSATVKRVKIELYAGGWKLVFGRGF